MHEFIYVRGARENNLKNIDVKIPRDKLVVFTGVSGSGKSSLAFDTIYSEGQRRYVESLSTYARQFLGQMDKPDVDYIEGLSPAISIDQKTTSNNPRSTVGTVTEIYDYLRLLFARVGKPHCPICHKPIQRQTIDQVVDLVMSWSEGAKIKILAPVVKGEKGEHRKTLEKLRKSGFVRLLIDGAEYSDDENISLNKNKKHDIAAVVDRLVVKPSVRSRLAESLELAFTVGEGVAVVVHLDTGGAEKRHMFSQEFACPDCGFSLPELSPRMFSFNSPYGACPECDGIGEKSEIDVDLLLEENNTLSDGAVIPWRGVFTGYYRQLLLSMAKKHRIPTDKPIKDLTPEQRRIILYGTDEERYKVSYTNSYGESREFKGSYEGVVNNLTRRHAETKSAAAREDIEKYMHTTTCAFCQGKRLRSETLWVLLAGYSIADVSRFSVREAQKFFHDLQLGARDALIAEQIIKEISSRLNFLMNVGLEYLSLSRSAGSLSGGEAQRIRLATQVGSGLVGVLYVLDEPSIGLHPRDNERLLGTLKRLRDLGNTVIVVEHDEETIKSADYIVDVGPGAGIYGGQVVASGSALDIEQSSTSVTGQYLAGKKKITTPPVRRAGNGLFLEIEGACQHNLKDINVKIPLGAMVLITGVSGSGKSTLIEDILYPALMRKVYGSRHQQGKARSIKGMEHIERVVNIDQTPIGRTPRSNPATYTGVFDHIRALFAETQDARARGYKPGRFSFNVKGGRCEACRGDGIIKIEMHFLPDVYVPCEVCKGQRYNRETLEIKYKGKSITDILLMPVSEAVEFFAAVPSIQRRLQVLTDVGLGYIKLGQPATELSGGEAQRVKLATELAKRSGGHYLYILDEPTTGLHPDDISHLLSVLNRLVDMGNSVVIIEHNLDVIKSADYIIDLGPEGGDNGGEVIACGTPEELAQVSVSHTGQYLQKILQL